MKHAVRLIAAVLSWILLFNLVACTEPNTEPEPESQPTEAVLTAAEIYNAAKASLLSAPNRIMTYSLSKERAIAGQAYTETFSGTASFSDLGTEQMIAVVDEDIRYGTVKAEYLLSFCNGRAYSRISGSTFAADMTADAFIAQQLPAAPLDTSLYGSITMTTSSDGTVITFSQAKGLESWVVKADAVKLTAASGTATLDVSGALVQTTYSAAYLYEGVPFSLDVTVRCTTPAQLELSALHPEHPDEYAVLSCLEAPKLLLRAAGDIFTSNAISASAAETIYSQIIPLTRARNSQMEISGTSATLSALLSNTVSITDYRGQTNATSQAYQFRNGVCTVSTNGSEPAVEAGISADAMRTNIEDTVLSALFATRYLAGATLKDEGDVYRLDFVGNEAYCSDLTRDLSAFLNLSMESVSSHHSTQASGYLCIDKITGLPVAMGMYFSRTHMFGDIPYVLSYQLDQVMILSPAE